MNIRLRALHEFAIPLVEPIVMRGSTLRERTGLYITLTDDAGGEGIGEIAPLPGFHSESRSDARRSLSDWLSGDLCPHLVPNDEAPRDELLTDIFRGLHELASIPSLHFGLSMAVVNLLADRRGIRPGQLLGDAPLARVRVNGLLAGAPQGWSAACSQYVKQEPTVIKVKVGRDTLEAEARALCGLQEAYGDRVSFILDGNRGWSYAQAELFLKMVSKVRIPYGEELLKDPWELPRLQRESGILMALDESLFVPGKYSGLIRDWRSVVALKPDRIPGSLVRCLQLAELMQRRGGAAVVSSAYNTPIGLSFLVQVASAMGCPHAGLGTYRWLPDTITTGLVPGKDGAVDAETSWVNALDGLSSYTSEIDLPC